MYPMCTVMYCESARSCEGALSFVCVCEMEALAPPPLSRGGHMSTRHGGAGEGQGGEQAPAKRRRRRREVTAGGGQQAAVAAWGEVPRYFDCLSEDLIGVVLSFLGVRCLDNACHVCKAVSQVARPLMALWIGVAASAEEDSAAAAAAAAAGGTAASRLPAHVKPTLQEALAAFQRFRMADMGGRGLEIRLVDNAKHTTGFLIGDAGNAQTIGRGDFDGLDLDGEYPNCLARSSHSNSQTCDANKKTKKNKKYT